jgi:hypothetical protein
VSLRIGVDLDGTLADLSAAYREIERRCFPEIESRQEAEAPDDGDLVEEPAELSDKDRLKAAKAQSRRREQIWAAIRNTTDFWTSLHALEPFAPRQLFEASREHGWEVFFITQRPRCAGASVQAQSQQWLQAHGFETPSVLTLAGSRGKAAHALELDFLIDDTPKNCVDVLSDSRCRPILVLREPSATAESAAKRMNIAVVRSVSAAIEMLAHPPAAPDLAGDRLGRVLKRLGFQR